MNLITKTTLDKLLKLVMDITEVDNINELIKGKKKRQMFAKISFVHSAISMNIPQNEIQEYLGFNHVGSIWEAEQRYKKHYATDYIFKDIADCVSEEVSNLTLHNEIKSF